MSKLAELKTITSKPELAALLGIKASMLTYTLYKLDPDSLYQTFTIPKKSGGTRTILAPENRLKTIQSCLSILLLDCIDEINKEHKRKDANYQPSLSHGFVRKRSIITNAMIHLNQKNVLNIDLADFFESFNFGRVRGFFIKNNHFKLAPDIATVIAQIACYKNILPQGSPCSPVITNLICHSLDIKLASLAKRHSCIYSRYADDITLSSRKNKLSKQIIRMENGEYVLGKKLKSEIRRAGFLVNHKKTRIQYKDSRQDVTGLIVNKKPNVKKEYWRTVRSQCNSLFHSGTFTKNVGQGEKVDGNINELEGQLNFIDQVDRFNRGRDKPPLNPIYGLAKYGYNTKKLLSGREKIFSRFLYYRLFYGQTKPTILCEGKTDNIYLKTAINKLAMRYTKLATAKTTNSSSELLVHFLRYSDRTRFLLQLYGGTSYLNYFISDFDYHYEFYKAPSPQHPVIIILDNDSGAEDILKKVTKLDSVVFYPKRVTKNKVREAKFIHVMHNLYIVLTPIDSTKSPTEMEDLFDTSTRNIKLGNKSFSTKSDFNEDIEYGKDFFAKYVVKAQKDSINFDGFKPLLDSVVQAIKHYDSIDK